MRIVYNYSRICLIRHKGIRKSNTSWGLEKSDELGKQVKILS